MLYNICIQHFCYIVSVKFLIVFSQNRLDIIVLELNFSLNLSRGFNEFINLKSGENFMVKKQILCKYTTTFNSDLCSVFYHYNYHIMNFLGYFGSIRTYLSI